MDIKPLNVVVIDDSPDNQASALDIKKLGHTVTVLGTVNEAHDYLEKCNQRRERHHEIPDVMLLDLWMPITNLTKGRCGDFGSYDQNGKRNHSMDTLPVGLVFALIAKNLGVQKIGILTHTNHHLDIMVALMKLMWVGDYRNRTFQFEQAHQGYSENGVKNWVNFLKSIL